MWIQYIYSFTIQTDSQNHNSIHPQGHFLLAQSSKMCWFFSMYIPWVLANMVKVSKGNSLDKKGMNIFHPFSRVQCKSFLTESFSMSGASWWGTKTWMIMMVCAPPPISYSQLKLQSASNKNNRHQPFHTLLLPLKHGSLPQIPDIILMIRFVKLIIKEECKAGSGVGTHLKENAN